MKRSLEFYTRVLDFHLVDDGNDTTDPAFALIAREPDDELCLSSYAGDGTFGQALLVTTDDVDSLFHKLKKRGLVPPERDSPVHHGPTDQTWGTREFYVDDPDGNTLRFTQGMPR
jgi:catechol 2,3-dioxygenase-like lactoylglutathione lyase family enzyme